jgi:hypothetical protein
VYSTEFRNIGLFAIEYLNLLQLNQMLDLTLVAWLRVRFIKYYRSAEVSEVPTHHTPKIVPQGEGHAILRLRQHARERVPA